MNQTLRRKYKSIKAKHDNMRSLPQRAADTMNNWFGSTGFLILNAICFFTWIVVNFGIVPILKPFDPYPFGLLTMVVSLEAIFLSIFVLLSQNRESRINTLREEVDLEVNIIAEQESTKILQLLTLLLKKNGIEVERDQELQEMLRKLDASKIERILEEQII